MDPQDLKNNQLLVTILVFNVFVIILMLLFVMLRGGLSFLGLFDFVIVLFVAGMAAGGAYVGIERMK